MAHLHRAVGVCAALSRCARNERAVAHQFGRDPVTEGWSRGLKALDAVLARIEAAGTVEDYGLPIAFAIPGRETMRELRASRDRVAWAVGEQMLLASLLTDRMYAVVDGMERLVAARNVLAASGHPALPPVELAFGRLDVALAGARQVMADFDEGS